MKAGEEYSMRMHVKRLDGRRHSNFILVRDVGMHMPVRLYVVSGVDATKDNGNHGRSELADLLHACYDMVKFIGQHEEALTSITNSDDEVEGKACRLMLIEPLEWITYPSLLDNASA
ncbi:hypothetical protein HPP92_006298 [Vanilla planifolia]|uniref:Uncharacterized protein n=1 Tax=Vanilla planifolia TaxID=51239 RepID=A0A835RP67_VANPL|nr:hypothetical protein HPP92_006298 [Vanilla planifolia]